MVIAIAWRHGTDNRLTRFFGGEISDKSRVLRFPLYHVSATSDYSLVLHTNYECLATIQMMY